MSCSVNGEQTADIWATVNITEQVQEACSWPLCYYIDIRDSTASYSYTLSCGIKWSLQKMLQSLKLHSVRLVFHIFKKNWKLNYYRKKIFWEPFRILSYCIILYHIAKSNLNSKLFRFHFHQPKLDDIFHRALKLEDQFQSSMHIPFSFFLCVKDNLTGRAYKIIWDH